MNRPLSIDVRADLFRAASGFSDNGKLATKGVLVEPMQRGGGVLLVGLNGYEMIVIPDPSGHASRAARLNVSNAMTRLAVDLFRRDCVVTRIRANEHMAWIEPKLANRDPAERNAEVETGPLNWRKEISRHAHKTFEGPFVGDANMARRLNETASVLARAADTDDDTWEIKGGVDGAVLAVFNAWPGAVALFTPRPALEDARATCVSTAWNPPDFIARGVTLGIVEGASV